MSNSLVLESIARAWDSFSARWASILVPPKNKLVKTSSPLSFSGGEEGWGCPPTLSRMTKPWELCNLTVAMQALVKYIMEQVGGGDSATHLPNKIPPQAHQIE